MEAHRGVPGGSFGSREWRLPDGALVRRILKADLETLRRWRNDQQSVLRQQEHLTSAHQRDWFETRIDPSYDLRRPEEILVVVEVDGEPVSYGGITNIEWVSHRGELSFLADSDRAVVPALYRQDFLRFLGWAKQFAFAELRLQRLFTETWASRQDHIMLLQTAGFQLEGRMRNHIVKDGLVQDALLHGLTTADMELA